MIAPPNEKGACYSAPIQRNDLPTSGYYSPLALQAAAGIRRQPAQRNQVRGKRLFSVDSVRQFLRSQMETGK